MASALEKTGLLCPERKTEEVKNAEEEEDEELRMRRKEGETKKDKDSEIGSEKEDSWQLWLRFCSHKLPASCLLGTKRKSLSRESKHCLAFKLVYLSNKTVESKRIQKNHRSSLKSFSNALISVFETCGCMSLS